VGEARFILDSGLDASQFALKVPGFVDGGVLLRRTVLQDEDGLIGPLTRFEECAVRGGFDENVVEGRIVRFLGGRSIGHAEPGSEIDPLAVVRGPDEFVVLSKLGSRAATGATLRRSATDRGG